MSGSGLTMLFHQSVTWPSSTVMTARADAVPLRGLSAVASVPRRARAVEEGDRQPLHIRPQPRPLGEQGLEYLPLLGRGQLTVRVLRIDCVRVPRGSRRPAEPAGDGVESECHRVRAERGGTGIRAVAFAGQSFDLADTIAG